MRYTFGRVEELLAERELASTEQLAQLREQLDRGVGLGQALESLSLPCGEDLMELLSEKMGVPYTPLAPSMVQPQAVELLSEEICRKFQVCPVMFVANILTVAMVDPQDLYVLDALRTTTGHPINPILCSPADIQACIENFFAVPFRVVSDSEATTPGRTIPENLDITDQDAAHISVVTLVDMMVTEALAQGASDIHIEGARDKTRIRYRVDGELLCAHLWPKSLQESVVSRLKVLSTLDITKRRVPQDGHFSVESEGVEVDFRVATTPTERGENCVIRILQQSRGMVRLDEVGFHPDDVVKVRRSLGYSQGFVLVTGPTGSGKTTTLYSMLNEVNSPARKIITIEDPVEYRLDLVNQIPVDYGAGLDFAKGMRSVLRQDPDIILVGEIRDRETAQIAVQASLTGHLLLSTLHTTGTVESLFRLTDIGIELFFVKEVLNCIVAQRLVRLLCPYCKEAYTPDQEQLSLVGLPSAPEGKKFFRPGGCYFCNQLGYKGRTAIMEVLVGSEKVKQVVAGGGSIREIRQEALAGGMRSFQDNAMEKVYAGLTSLDEVRRVIPPDVGLRN